MVDERAYHDGGDLVFPNLALNEEYKTGDDLLGEFYNPTLRRAISYDRAAGYFDSRSLQYAAQGIVGLILNEGTMRLIVSPNLSTEDKEALISATSDEDQLDVLTEALDTHLFAGQFQEFIETDRFKCLAWMVDNGFLEIKLAYMVEDEGLSPFRIYHEKIGIMKDVVGNELAFTGSINETAAGWTGNYESFEVFRSWKQGEKSRIENKKRRFQRLWDNDDPMVVVRELPDAIKQGIRDVSPGTVDGLPALDMFFSEEGSASSTSQGMRLELWDHQQEAIEWWRENEYTGIFAMATGTGKTLTALRALRLQADVRLSIVVVPSKVLLDQWRDEITTVFGPQTEILECSGRTDWRQEMLPIVDPFRVGSLDAIHDLPRTVLLTTIHTAASEAFQKFVSHIPQHRLQIVVDEVHRAGAPTFQKIFDIDAARRIGLSATPDRKWDEEGTRAVYDYFGGQDPFRFTTKEAIENGYLTRYEYHPLICELKPEEYDKYAELSEQIDQMTAQVVSSDNVDEDTLGRYEYLLRERAKIKKRARMKPDRFGEFLDTSHPTPAIVFCEDTEQLEEIEAQLADRGVAYGVYISNREEEQADAFYRFEKGLIDYLLAIKCLDEGVDVPDCATAVIIASSRNEREFIQRRGRVLRKSDQYDRAKIYDMLVLPGLAAHPDDEQAKNLIQQELERAKILMSAAENRDMVEQKLAEELDTYGSGYRYLAYTK